MRERLEEGRLGDLKVAGKYLNSSECRAMESASQDELRPMGHVDKEVSSSAFPGIGPREGSAYIHLERVS